MSASAGVRPEQRFTPERPCPICGGHDRAPRGEGKRCYGFVSEDGAWAHCTREEHAGGAPRNDKSEAFVHKLTGDCKCGSRHDLAAGERGDRTRRLEGRRRIVKTYDYPDERGKLQFQTVRYEPKDFRQRRPDGEGGWIWDLQGVRLTLYRLPDLLAADRGELTLVAAGEKDADTGHDLGFPSTTNPLGEGKWRPVYAEPLRGRPVAIIAHRDGPGRKHADDVARSLHGKAASVKVMELQAVPEGGGDLTDWANAGGTGEELRRLIAEEPEWSPPEERDDGRVLLGRAIRDGLEPPVAIVEDVILEAKAHAIYSAGGLGKTFLMLWIILQVLTRGAPVLLYDKENGHRTMARRLEQLGADPERVDALLYYYPDASLPTTTEGLEAFEAKLDRIKPALACFDSWISYLASNGLDENSSNDIAAFAAHYIHPARSRGVATLLIDHVPHDGKHARGSTRKRDELDVVWSLTRLQPFDRENVGSVHLKLEKDREGWLPRDVGFSIGGNGRGGFVCARSAGTFEAAGTDGLKPSERKALEALETFGKSTATASEWRQAAEKLDVGERSFWNAVRSLKEKKRVLQENKAYKIATATDCNSTAMHQNAVDPNTTATAAPPLEGAAGCSTGATEDEYPDLREMFGEEGPR
jgi:hypothetical protein